MCLPTACLLTPIAIVLYFRYLRITLQLRKSRKDCHITKIRRRAKIHYHERERPVRVTEGKIETNPELMHEGVEYPVVYKGEKYYVKKYDENRFGISSAR